MENKINKISCPLCSSESLYWGAKNNYNLFKCIDCKLIFVNPLPNPDKIYNEDYFAGAKKGFGYVDYDTDKEPMIPVFNKYLDLISLYGKKNGSLLDVGAATGFFINLAKKRGFDVSGVEMSEHASSIARNKGFNVETGDLMSMDVDSDSFDVVTMLDVLEHLTDPVAEIHKVSSIMKSGGLLVINSPDGESLLSKILKTKWHLVLPPEHLFYFSPKNLTKVLKREGFTVVYDKTIGKKFTFQYIFIMLYKWQKLAIWNHLSKLFSKGFLSKLYIPINLHDNFFIIAKKD